MKRKFLSLLAVSMALVTVMGSTVMAAGSITTNDAVDKLEPEDKTTVEEIVKNAETSTVDEVKLEEVTAVPAVDEVKTTELTVTKTEDAVVATGAAITAVVGDETYAEVTVTLEPVTKADTINSDAKEAKKQLDAAVAAQKANMVATVLQQTKIAASSVGKVVMKPQAQFELTLDVKKDDGTSVGVKGQKLDITIPAPIKGMKETATKKYVALHEAAAGVWETIPVTVNADGTITLKGMTGASPVVIMEVEVQQKDVEPPKTTEPSTTEPSTTESSTTASGAPASPKTGETLPMAGTAVLLCLAGAAVCAKKARI